MKGTIDIGGEAQHEGAIQSAGGPLKCEVFEGVVQRAEAGGVRALGGIASAAA